MNRLRASTDTVATPVIPSPRENQWTWTAVPGEPGELEITVLGYVLGPDVPTGFEFRAREDGDPTWGAWTAMPGWANEFPFVHVVDGLDPVAYEVQLRVEGGGGESFPSDTKVATPEPPPPATPQTWDPATKGAGVTLSNGDLTANVTTFGNRVFSTGAKTAGKWYFELLIGTITSVTSTGFGVGLASLSGSGVVPNSGDCVSQGLSTGSIIASSGIVPGSGNLVPGDVVGVTYDCATGQANFYKNGVANGSGVTAVGVGMRVFAWQHWNPENRIFTIRTTPAEFDYAPPDGFLPWAFT